MTKKSHTSCFHIQFGVASLQCLGFREHLHGGTEGSPIEAGLAALFCIPPPSADGILKFLMAPWAPMSMSRYILILLVLHPFLVGEKSRKIYELILSFLQNMKREKWPASAKTQRKVWPPEQVENLLGGLFPAYRRLSLTFLPRKLQCKSYAKREWVFCALWPYLSKYFLEAGKYYLLLPKNVAQGHLEIKWQSKALVVIITICFHNVSSSLETCSWFSSLVTVQMQS